MKCIKSVKTIHTHIKMSYYCLLERDNGELRPLVSKERLEAIFDGTIIIISISIIPYLVYSFANLFWSLFTPGQQWFEIGTIIFGTAILIIGKFGLDELTNKFAKKIEDLKQENEAQKKQIDLSEDANAALNNKITNLEKRIKLLSVNYN